MSHKAPEEDLGLSGFIYFFGIATILLGWVFVEWQTYLVAAIIAVATMASVVVWTFTSPTERDPEQHESVVVQIGSLSLHVDQVLDDLQISAEELGHLAAAELQKQLVSQFPWIRVRLAGTRRGSWILDIAIYTLVVHNTLDWLGQYERASKGLTAVLGDLKTVGGRLAQLFEREDGAPSKLLTLELRLETAAELCVRLGMEEASYMNNEVPEADTGAAIEQAMSRSDENDLPAVNLPHLIQPDRRSQTTARKS